MTDSDPRKWIVLPHALPPESTDVWIRMPYGERGLAIYDREAKMWYGYSGNYLRDQVEAWAYQCEGDPLHEGS